MLQYEVPKFHCIFIDSYIDVVSFESISFGNLFSIVSIFVFSVFLCICSYILFVGNYVCMQICCVNCQFYLLVLVVTTFVFIFPFLKGGCKSC